MLFPLGSMVLSNFSLAVRQWCNEKVSAGQRLKQDQTCLTKHYIFSVVTCVAHCVILQGFM